MAGKKNPFPPKKGTQSVFDGNRGKGNIRSQVG